MQIKNFLLQFSWLRLAAGSLGIAVMLTGCSTREKPSVAIEPPIRSVVLPSRVKTDVEIALRVLTLREAIQRAQLSNLKIQSLQAAVAVAKAQRSAASDFDDPEALGYWGNVTDELDSDLTQSGRKQWRVGGRFYVPNPLLIAPRVSARTSELLAAKADLAAARWSVKCDVQKLFGEIAFCQSDLAIAAELAKLNSEIQQDTRKRADSGVATAADLVAAAEKQIQAEQDLAKARHRYLAVQNQLAALLNFPLQQIQISTNDLNFPSAPNHGEQPEFFQNEAFTCRADLAAARWRTCAAESEYRRARNERVPWLKDVTVWNREPKDQWWLGAAVTVPIFSWTKNHAGDVLRSERDVAALNETNQMQIIRVEIQTALAELEEQQRQQERFETDLTPLLASMRKTLEVLQSTPNVLPAQIAATKEQILECNRIELDRQWEFHLAALNLEQAVGRPLGKISGESEP